MQVHLAPKSSIYTQVDQAGLFIHGSRGSSLSPSSVRIPRGGKSRGGLWIYLDRTQSFRQLDILRQSLFCVLQTSKKRQALQKQQLSHWIVEAIKLAYSVKGQLLPGNLRAHSTGGMAVSWA